MTKIAPGIGLRTGLAVFVVVKCLFVLLFTKASAVPRLGDDSFVYLWQGQLMVSSIEKTSPAVKDIKELWALDDRPSLPTSIFRAYTQMQVSTLYPFSAHSLLTGGLLALGIPARWAFCATEIIIAILLAVGIAAFLKELFGEGAAGFALALLSVSVFPLHGLQQLVPSVMCLALALILWARILANANPWPGPFLLALALAGIHQIAKAYLVGALALAVVAALAARDWSSRRWCMIGGMVLALASAFILARPMLPYHPPGTVAWDVGTVTLANARINWPAARGFLLEYAGNNLLTLGLCCGGVVFFGRCHLTRLGGSVLVLCSAMLAGSLLHLIPHFEADLFCRLLVPCVILVAGCAGLFCARLVAGRPPAAGWALVALFCLSICHGIQRYAAYCYVQLNKHSAIETRALHAQIQDIPDGTSMLYLDHPSVMIACLLEGAWRLPAMSWAMIKGSGSQEKYLSGHPPGMVVAYPYRWLNTLALLGDQTLTRRRHGFRLKDFAGLSVEGQGLSGKMLAIFVKNDGPGFAIEVDGAADCGPLQVPTHHAGWLSIPPACSAGKRVSFSLPDHPAWVAGVSLGPPRSRVYWPWSQERTVVEARFRRPLGMQRSEPGCEIAPERLSFDFSFASLLSYDGASGAAALLLRPLEVVSDESGLVFIRNARS
ncbi:MAG: hypothetical protein HY748_11050 [Elusimicrobia bacterium]|nr:hypothetical protein [Elusimicrobiota bacterium]